MVSAPASHAPLAYAVHMLFTSVDWSICEPAAALIAALAALIGAIGALLIHRKVTRIEVVINHRLDELLTVSVAAARAAGIEEHRLITEQRAAAIPSALPKTPP
jgi:Trk-type K+ transport system membrane component